MRRRRSFLLVVIIGILAAVAISYYIQTKTQQREAPRKPDPLPPNTSAAASGWSWTKTEGSRTVVEVRAAKLREAREPSRVELENVELRIFDEKGATFHQVRCAGAELDTANGVLHSPGEVEITMGVPAQEQPAGRLVFIRATGVTLDSKTGKVSTDGPAAFRFDQGEGRAVGASYDPKMRELQMRSQAEVVWYGHGPNRVPMKVEAGALSYRERDAAIILSPWSRLVRGGTSLEAGEAFVFLKEGTIRQVDTRDARGKSRQNGKLLEYAAGNLRMEFDPVGAVERVLGDRDARLSSSSPASRTEVSTDRLELLFETSGGESHLRKAIATGHSVVQSTPPRGADVRILRSDVIHLAMRSGGEEIQSVETHTPGSIEFIPGSPRGKKRHLEAERMWIDYGNDNHIRSFRAVRVSTRTEAAPVRGRPSPPPMLTWSNLLVASFDPKNGALSHLEQSDKFRYEEGARRGNADRAVLDSPAERITLEGSARLWEPGGSTSADRIVLDQKTGDLTAEGRVASSRLPDSQSKPVTMMSQEKAVQSTAARFTVRDRNQLLRYEGNAVLWQGGNRIEADQIEIDRSKRQLRAIGKVKTRFVEPVPQGTPVFTIIEAAEMFYEESSRIADYRGGVKLVRDWTTVTSQQLRAHLLEAQAGTQLQKAVADGGVVILHTAAGRSRKATADHAEYYASEQRVMLSGGRPAFVDSERGTTEGRRLTWFVNDDRLLVEGGEGSPAVSRIRRQ